MRLGWIAVALCVSSAGGEQPWWRTATFYEIYPQSFKDSDGDGVGDFKGIIQNAEYLQEIGVDAVWLVSQKLGFDYWNSEIDSVQDFDDLRENLKQIGVKLLMDFVPNHTSDKHAWFQMSSNTSHPLHQYYKDFYVWRPANGTTPDGKPIPPNNWLSVVGGPAWTWCEQRQQFYLHQFLSEQPDLNFRNLNVVGNVTDFILFWLNKGVDGFRLDVAPHIFEDADLTDEPPIPGTSGDSWFTLNHTSTKHQPETFVLLQYWSDVIYHQAAKEGTQKVLLLEVYAEAPLANKYYGTGQRNFQIPFNFMLMMKGSYFTQPMELKELIHQWLAATPPDGVANWVVGNHYLTRVSDLYGRDMVDIINMLSGVLPGVKVIYYGEEIGMEKSPVSWNQTVDPWARHQGAKRYHEWSRDFIRTPMQWDDSLNAGFSTNSTTWLPVNPNYWWLNVEAQRTAPASHLKVFQAMAKARKDPVLQRGDLQVLVPDSDTLAVVRSLDGCYYLLIINLGNNPARYTSSSLFDMDMTLVVGSLNSGYLPGTNFKKGSIDIKLWPKAAILLQSPAANSSDTRVINTGVSVCFFVLIVILSVFSLIT